MTTTEILPEVQFLHDLYNRICQYATDRRRMIPVVHFDAQRVENWTTAEGRHLSTINLGIDLEKADIFAKKGLILGVVLGQGSRTRHDSGHVTRLQFGGWYQSLETQYCGQTPDLSDLQQMVHWHPLRHHIGFFGEFYFDENYPGMGLQESLPHRRSIVRLTPEERLSERGLTDCLRVAAQTIKPYG